MKVCFIGHRTIVNAEQISGKLHDIVLTLIGNGADTFLFGSKSDFDILCWEVVTEIQAQYPHIVRINYGASNETAFTSKEERQRYESSFSQIAKREVHYTDYEKAVSSQKSLNANKNSYIMRNREMIDDSDICVFYYDKDYLPPNQISSNNLLPDYQPKSGTAIAFAYATRKKKCIYNTFG